MKPGKLFPAVLLSLFLLASCIDGDLELRAAADGSAQLSADLKVSSLAIPMLSREYRGNPGPSNPGISLPLSREALAAIIAGQPGARLESWEQSEAEGILSISTALSFPNLDALISFLNSLGMPASSLSSGARRGFALQLDQARPVKARTDSRNSLPESLQRLYESWRLSLLVEAPARIALARGGTADGRQARFNRPSTDLIFSSSPLRWDVQW